MKKIKDLTGIVFWLHNGKFTSETTEQFNKIITGFGKLAVREQEDILEILKYMAENNMNHLDEEEVLEWIRKIHKKAEK